MEVVQLGLVHLAGFGLGQRVTHLDLDLGELAVEVADFGHALCVVIVGGGGLQEPFAQVGDRQPVQQPCQQQQGHHRQKEAQQEAPALDALLSHFKRSAQASGATLAR